MEREVNGRLKKKEGLVRKISKGKVNCWARWTPLLDDEWMLGKGVGGITTQTGSGAGKRHQWKKGCGEN